MRSPAASAARDGIDTSRRIILPPSASLVVASRRLALREAAGNGGGPPRPIDPDAYARYIDEVSSIWARKDDLGDGARGIALRKLREIEEAIRDRVLTDKGRLGGHNVRQLREIIARLADEFEVDLISYGDGAIGDARDLASGPVDAAVEIMGSDPLDPDEYDEIWGVSDELLDTARDLHADQIRVESEDLKRRISMHVSLAALGARDLGDSLRAIRDELYGDEASAAQTRRLGGYPYRAEMILRTEIGRAFNGTNQEFNDRFLKRNRRMRKTWNGIDDHRQRESHRRAAERYSEENVLDCPRIDEPFVVERIRERRRKGVVSYEVVGTEKMMQPGDPEGSGENVINCRCWSNTVDPVWFGIEDPGEDASASGDVDGDAEGDEFEPESEPE